MERDLLVMKERLGFIATNDRNIKLSAKSNEVIKNCKINIEQLLSKVREISQKTLKDTSFKTISNHLNSIQDNVKEIFREVMFSTYPSHRESVCRALEKAA